MEVFSSHTRFIIICNYVSRLISPLASRCAKFRFLSVPEQTLRSRLEWICDQEGVEIELTAIEVLTKASKGDLRRAIMLLESAAKFNKFKITKFEIFEKYKIQTFNFRVDLLDLSGLVDDEIIQCFLEESAKSPGHCYQQVKSVTKDGYSIQQILLQLSDLILKSMDFNEVQKV